MPQPLSPTSATHSFACTSRSIPRSARSRIPLAGATELERLLDAAQRDRDFAIGGQGASLHLRPGRHDGRRQLLGDLMSANAGGRASTAQGRSSRRHLPSAGVARKGAARRERASGWRIAHVGRLTCQGRQGQSPFGVERDAGAQQSGRVGVRRLRENLGRATSLGDTARVADGDPVGDLRGYAQIVGYHDERAFELVARTGG